MSNRGPTAIFITASDTGVGKTMVSSLLLGFLLERGVRAGYQKWVSTGGELPEDLIVCLDRNRLPFDRQRLEMLVPYRFALPASPHLAAEQEGRQIDPQRIKERFARALAQHEVLLVEGIGGALVPLRRDLLLADFLADLALPVLIVTRSGLGTINHTLLTVEALRHRGLTVLGVIFSDEREEMASGDPLIADNMQTVGSLAGVDVFGRLPRSLDYGRLKREFEPIGSAIWQKLGLHPFRPAPK